MDKNTLQNEYFEWMCFIVHEDECEEPHQKLLRHLYNVEFTYIIDMDANRASHGVNLRYRFGYENNYSRQLIERYLDDKPCSVLEMMVALALACEEDIMTDPDIGDRTGIWFWGMIENLGLSDMDDDNYHYEYVDHVIDTFLSREYKRNGDGGLFTLKHSRLDMRNVEIWYQMMWFLDENFDFTI